MDPEPLFDRSPDGRLFASLAEARGAAIAPGDAILLRRLDELAPAAACTTEPVRGRWLARPYRLAGGQEGMALTVNDRSIDEPHTVVPPAFDVELDLPGWYAIWLGIPLADEPPLMTGAQLGLDLALASDVGFVHVGCERGTRRGLLLGPTGLEVACFWKCAPLDGERLRIRVPFGTYRAHPCGMVLGAASSLYLLRLDDRQARAYRDDLGDRRYKRVITHVDGFGDHWDSDPGTGPHERLVANAMLGDVGRIIHQSVATSVVSWPSRVTGLYGGMMEDSDWPERAHGEGRAHRYMAWACANGQEAPAVLSRLCRRAGIEYYTGVRMNLFFKQTAGDWGKADRLNNGRWWYEHPELRKPGLSQIDYAQPAARRFVIDIITEVAGAYDVAGINLDFTRWPPVADPSRHDGSVLSGLIVEVRRALDQVSARTGRPLALNAAITDGFRALTHPSLVTVPDGWQGTLEDQRIDFERWLASGCLDFVLVEAKDFDRHAGVAARHRVPCVALNDNEAFDSPVPNDLNPEWATGDDHDDDHVRRIDLKEHVRVGPHLDPTELNDGYLQKYRDGAAGICAVNVGHWRTLGSLGHVEEMERRAGTGRRWGQRIGQPIELL